jgi:DnaJ-class molecular chaperone
MLTKKCNTMEAPKKCPNCYGAGYIAGKQGDSMANFPCPICSEKGMIDQANIDKGKVIEQLKNMIGKVKIKSEPLTFRKYEAVGI